MEAHDSGTVEPLTGAARSAHKALPDSNRPHSQHQSGEGEGGRKRAASDTGSSTSSSRNGTSVKATQQRRRPRGRQDNCLQAKAKNTEGKDTQEKRELKAETRGEEQNEAKAKRGVFKNYVGNKQGAKKYQDGIGDFHQAKTKATGDDFEGTGDDLHQAETKADTKARTRFYQDGIETNLFQAKTEGGE